MNRRELREAAKKRLQVIGYLQRRVRALERRQATLRTRADGLRGIAYDGDRVQTSPHNTQEDTLLMLYDVEEQYAHTLEDLYMQLQDREKEIDSLPDPVQREVLKALYIDESERRVTLWMVAEALHRSYDSVRHIHTAGLIAYGRRYIDTN